VINVQDLDQDQDRNVQDLIAPSYLDCTVLHWLCDVLPSGHAAFWVLAPLAFQTYYPRYK
jgi:hypothetical protein